MKKTVLITGASRGIGKSIAEKLAAGEYQVIINYHRSKEAALALEASLKSQGYAALAIKADVSQKVQVEEMVKAGVRAFGSIDVLINNAGISQSKLLTDIEEGEWDQMMAVHLKGMYLCSRAVIPAMVEKKQGKILNISSIWGLVGASCEVHYSAAKAGMIGFTKALAKELGPSHIQVNCIAPGVIETGMLDEFSQEERQGLIEQTPLMRLGKPEDVAAVVKFLLSKEADFITGQVISPNGGFVI